MGEEKEMEKTTPDEIKNSSLGEQIEDGSTGLEDKASSEFKGPQFELSNEESEEELSLAEILYGTVAIPNETFVKLGKNPPVLKGVFIVIAVYIFIWLLSFSDLRNAIMMGDFVQIPEQFFVLFGIFGVIFALLFWFVISGSLSLWASILGGRDNTKGLLVCYGFAIVPYAFSGALQTLVNFAGLHTAMSGLITILVLVWVVYLQMVAVRATQGLSTGMSLFVALTPILAIAALVIITISLLLLLMMAFIPMF